MGTPVTGFKLAAPGKLKHTKHVVRGVVHEARHHYNGKHVMLEIRHGKKPKAKKGRNGDIFPSDDRANSSFAIPPHIAKHYPIGTPVHIGITPVGAKGSALEGDDAADQDDKDL